MAFNATHVEGTNVVTAPSTSPKEIQNDPNQLDTRELVFLLEILKKTQFVGEQVEIVYGSVLKLQNQYIKLTNK